MLLAFSVAPSGTGREDGSVHDAVAAAVKVVRDSGLPNRTSSMFTEVEGTWDEVFGVVAHLGLIRANGLGLALAIAGSTVLAISAGALAFVAVARITGSTDPEAERRDD